MGLTSYASDASNIAYVLRTIFDKICGKEEMNRTINVNYIK